MSDNLVIYHGHCMDGFTAAWVCWRRFGDKAEYFAADYPPGDQETELPDVRGRNVIMVDFCVSREHLLRLSGEAKSLVVLDHHKSHEEACRGLSFCTFDMDQSGAGLAWRYFRGVTNLPWLVAYVEDRDLWRFALPESKAVNAYVSTREQTFGGWDGLQRTSKKVAASRGQAILAYIDRYVAEMSEQARRITFAGHDDIPVVNAPYINTSELVGNLAKSVLFAVGWFQRGDGLYQYSLRSRDGDPPFDVSELAKQFGGGGHAQAAGFTVKELVHG